MSSFLIQKLKIFWIKPIYRTKIADFGPRKNIYKQQVDLKKRENFFRILLVYPRGLVHFK